MCLLVIIHVFETKNIFLNKITAYNFLDELFTLFVGSGEFSLAQLGLIFVKGVFYSN